MNNAIATTTRKPRTLTRWAGVVSASALAIVLGYGAATVAADVADAHAAATSCTSHPSQASCLPGLTPIHDDAPSAAPVLPCGWASVPATYTGVCIDGLTGNLELIDGPATHPIMTHAVPLLYGNGVN
jgi:hypothetical protein